MNLDATFRPIVAVVFFTIIATALPFGEPCRTYQSRTGRFLPKVGRSRD